VSVGSRRVDARSGRARSDCRRVANQPRLGAEEPERLGRQIRHAPDVRLAIRLHAHARHFHESFQQRLEPLSLSLRVIAQLLAVERTLGHGMISWMWPKANREGGIVASDERADHFQIAPEKVVGRESAWRRPHGPRGKLERTADPYGAAGGQPGGGLAMVILRSQVPAIGV
jgi:hypothetical protein